MISTVLSLYSGVRSDPDMMIVENEDISTVHYHQSLVGVLLGPQ